MSLAEWLRAFRDLHARAHRGELSPDEQVEYRERREELARVLLATQKLCPREGETPRQALRVPRALQADVTWPKGSARALTLDLGTGGFAVLLAKAPASSDEVKFALKLPGGATISGAARVADIRGQGASARVALAVKNLSDADRERLELAVFDAVLDQLAG